MESDNKSIIINLNSFVGVLCLLHSRFLGDRMLRGDLARTEVLNKEKRRNISDIAKYSQGAYFLRDMFLRFLRFYRGKIIKMNDY